jgi:hypothetical protein
MVYDKARSGDPDYDDKQPPEHHAGNVVSAGDGVFITPQGGAVDVNGAHVNLAGTDEDGDNRPTPGNVAKVASTVQNYTSEDTPTSTEPTKADKATVDAIKAGQTAMINAGQQAANGGPEDNQADETHSAAGTSTPPKSSTTSTARK